MKTLTRLAISIGMSCAILALLLKLFTSGISDGQRPSVLSALQATSISLVLVYLFLYLIALLIRAYRYRLLLRLAGEENVPTFPQMAMVTGIRNMIVDMFPARLGELGYVGLLNRGYGVKLSHCVSSLSISLAFDFIALFVIVVFIVAKQLVAQQLEGWAIGALISALALSVVAVLGLFVIVPMVSRYLSAKTGDKSSWISKLTTLLAEFSESLQTVRQSGQTLTLFLLSLAVRILKYLSLFALFQAVVKPSFAELAQLPVEKVFGALIGGEVGASLPIPTFMSFGAYEAGSTLVFQLLGVTDKLSAVISMLCTHIWSQLMEYTIGGILLALFILLNRRYKNSVKQQRAETGKVTYGWRQWVSLLSAGAVMVLGSFFLAYQLWAASKLGSIKAPDAGQVSADVGEWRELSKQHTSRLNGFVVFSSNRDGNHDIFKLNLADFQLSKLTTHPNTETYPRISPNGKRLVFARGHQAWVPQRNTVAWDVYVLDLKTMQEKKVGENGTSPRWIDNQHISFAQQRTRVLKVNIDTLEQEVLFEAGVNNNIPAGTPISNPDYNARTGQLVLTGRQNKLGMNAGHWGTALIDGSEHRGVYNGCELNWSHDGKELYQMTSGGRGGGNRIIRIDPKTLQAETMVDLAGEFSHEYWPKASSNGDYLVFGASRSRKEHEHDTQDYEIFLWKMGSDASEATRLTFHTGNDNWPDVYIE